MEQETRKWAAYAGYFITGAGIGAALGVLFAPKPGRETREQMSFWLNQKRELGRIEYRAMKDALSKSRKGFLSREKVDSVG